VIYFITIIRFNFRSNFHIDIYYSVLANCDLIMNRIHAIKMFCFIKLKILNSIIVVLLDNTKLYIYIYIYIYIYREFFIHIYIFF